MDALFGDNQGFDVVHVGPPMDMLHKNPKIYLIIMLY